MHIPGHANEITKQKHETEMVAYCKDKNNLINLNSIGIYYHFSFSNDVSVSQMSVACSYFPSDKSKNVSFDIR